MKRSHRGTPPIMTPTKRAMVSAHQKNVNVDSKINDDLKDLHIKIRENSERRSKMKELLETIRGVEEKVESEGRLSNYHKSKLKTLYTNLLRETEGEAKHLAESLKDIAEIRQLKNEKRFLARHHHGSEMTPLQSSKIGTPSTPMRKGTLMVLLQQAANVLPLWIGEIGENPPHLCGALPPPPGHQCEVGDAVAALVKNHDADSGADQEADAENWILAEVVNVLHSGRYEVEDVDEEQKERHCLPTRKVIPLPTRRANPQTDVDALFPIDSVVLALYPQTTCFYKGVVERQPSTATDDYLIAFDDANHPSGYSPPLSVPQRYVVPHKKVR